MWMHSMQNDAWIETDQETLPAGWVGHLDLVYPSLCGDGMEGKEVHGDPVCSGWLQGVFVIWLFGIGRVVADLVGHCISSHGGILVYPE